MDKQRFWLVGIGSHMPVIPGDILDMPGAPEPVRLVSVHGDQARVATSAGASMVAFSTVGIARADAALCRPRPAEGPLDHRAHRLSALTGAADEAVFYVLWTSFDGLTPAALPYLAELPALTAFLGCCAEPSNLKAQVIRRHPKDGDTVLVAFERSGVPVTALKPDWNAAA